MPEQERMTIEGRYNYLRAQRRRYQGADRQDKSRLLDEMEAVTGLHRKSLIRLRTHEPQRMQHRPDSPQPLVRPQPGCGDTPLVAVFRRHHREPAQETP